MARVDTVASFHQAPVGVGDLTSGLPSWASSTGQTAKHALEHTASAYFEVMKATSAVDEYELQLVAAQDGLVNPTDGLMLRRFMIARIVQQVKSVSR